MGLLLDRSHLVFSMYPEVCIFIYCLVLINPASDQSQLVQWDAFYVRFIVWSWQIRLLTGVGRFSEMTYIFDLLKQNHQFELLFRKGIDRVRGRSLIFTPSFSRPISSVLPTIPMARTTRSNLRVSSFPSVVKIAVTPFESVFTDFTWVFVF